MSANNRPALNAHQYQRVLESIANQADIIAHLAAWCATALKATSRAA